MPVTPVTLEAPSLMLGDAIKDALQNRLELAELRTNDEINQIDRKYYRDQIRPQMDLTLGYSTGIVDVASLAATASAMPPGAARIETRLRTSSAASCAMRSYCSSAER